MFRKKKIKIKKLILLLFQIKIDNKYSKMKCKYSFLNYNKRKPEYDVLNLSLVRIFPLDVLDPLSYSRKFNLNSLKCSREREKLNLFHLPKGKH